MVAGGITRLVVLVAQEEAGMVVPQGVALVSLEV